MTLAPGTRLGSYEVIARIGIGGMGEVYRARDTMLGRDVAIKILSATLVGDASGSVRFEREARSLAALNHAHIATLYGFELFGDTRALVMELVEGDTLADRLTHGSLPVPEALAIARQVADALDAAHAKGIVHRDLKPANVKLTPAGTAKVLDFGLAKATSRASIEDELPTVVDATREGVVVGTAAYMSPQQARGQNVDRDADIWAFGCVLYELLAGRKAFSGATMSDTIANVLQREPDWTALPPSVPAEAVRLIRRCLVKDPARRLRDIGDARLEIEELLATGATPSAIATAKAAPVTTRRSRRLAAGVLAGIALGVGAGVLAPRILGLDIPDRVTASAVSVFGMSEPAGESLYSFVTPVVVSPDGSQIALVTNGPEGRPRLWLRSLNDIEAKLIEDAAGAIFPFWSPDGQSLGFTVGKELRVMSLASRSVRTLTEISGAGPSFATWGRDETILFSDGFNGLKRIPASGGTPVSVAAPGPSGEPSFVVAPHFLPDGRHFLYLASGNQPGEGTVMVGDLDSSSRTKVLAVDSVAYYASEHLLYARNGDLVAHRFDTATRQLVGDPAIIGRGIWVSGSQTAFSASQTGVIALANQRLPPTELVWVDRAGKTVGSLLEPGLWVHVAIAPDGKTVAAERIESRNGRGGIWTIDVSRAVASRVSTDSTWGLGPVWAPGSDRLAYTSFSQSGNVTIIAALPDGSGRETLPVKLDGPGGVSDWSPDGHALVLTNANDVVRVMLDGKGQMTSLVQTPFNEAFGKVSPDGRWLAYASNESGRPEIYVRPLGGSAGRVRVSQSGGTQPRWRRDGKELYFVAEAGRIMASAITLTPAFNVGAPVDLDIETERDLVGLRYMYDVADLGQRFLMIRRRTRVDPAPITVILNWPGLAR